MPHLQWLSVIYVKACMLIMLENVARCITGQVIFFQMSTSTRYNSTELGFSLPRYTLRTSLRQSRWLTGCTRTFVINILQLPGALLADDRSSGRTLQRLSALEVSTNEWKLQRICRALSRGKTWRQRDRSPASVGPNSSTDWAWRLGDCSTVAAYTPWAVKRLKKCH